MHLSKPITTSCGFRRHPDRFWSKEIFFSNVALLFYRITVFRNIFELYSFFSFLKCHPCNLKGVSFSGNYQSHWALDSSCLGSRINEILFICLLASYLHTLLRILNTTVSGFLCTYESSTCIKFVLCLKRNTTTFISLYQCFQCLRQLIILVRRLGGFGNMAVKRSLGGEVSNL